MKLYLVTGSSTGIGEFVVRSLLKTEGNRVLGVSRRDPPQFGNNYTHIKGDITDAKVQESVLKAVGDRLDGVVMNAGLMSAVTKIRNLSPELSDLRKVFDVNFFSVVSLTSRLIPALSATNGRAVFVSSGASVSGYTAWTAYGSSKAALNLFVSTLAVEEPEITAISIAPGVVDTEMQKDIRDLHVKSGEMNTDDAGKFLSLKRDGKLVKPEDAGNLYANVVQAVSHDLSGSYLRYNDPKLARYADDRF